MSNKKQLKIMLPNSKDSENSEKVKDFKNFEKYALMKSEMSEISGGWHLEWINGELVLVVD